MPFDGDLRPISASNRFIRKVLDTSSINYFYFMPTCSVHSLVHVALQRTTGETMRKNVDLIKRGEKTTRERDHQGPRDGKAGRMRHRGQGAQGSPVKGTPCGHQVELKGRLGDAPGRAGETPHRERKRKGDGGTAEMHQEPNLTHVKMHRRKEKKKSSPRTYNRRNQEAKK